LRSQYYYIEVEKAYDAGGEGLPLMKSDALGEFEQSLLLAIIHLGDNAYGVTIRQEIEARTGREIAVGALYTSLARLERKGYVSSTMSDPTPQRGGRSKRHFTLRPAGATALRQSHERLAQMWKGLRPDLRRTRS
jgi:DNA-binding PadR family transcriptional regulator